MSARVKGRARTGATTRVSTISYHNGPVMTGPTNV